MAPERPARGCAPHIILDIQIGTPLQPANYIDEGHDGVIFFADEAGSWQVGVDWAKVLPVWFKVLSPTAEPNEYAQQITALLSSHYSYGRDKMLAIARRTATPDQRKALAEIDRA